MLTNSQGSTANKNGKIFEQIMVPLFQNHGFAVVTEADIKNDPLIIAGFNRYVIHNASFTTIYNQIGRTEYVIVDGAAGPNIRKVRVEAKWQQSKGSVDEKYPYMLLNGIYQYPEHEIIFVVDGNGYKPGARQWLKDKIDNNWLDYKNTVHKDIKLMTIAEFLTWFNNEF